MITKNFLFLILPACIPSHLIAECIGIEKFQTCADKNGIISSVNETGLHNSFPEASQGNSDWEKKLKEIDPSQIAGHLGDTISLENTLAFKKFFKKECKKKFFYST